VVRIFRVSAVALLMKKAWLKSAIPVAANARRKHFFMVHFLIFVACRRCYNALGKPYWLKFDDGFVRSQNVCKTTID
jgi:hypothetical protein